MGTSKSGPGNPDTVNQGPAPDKRREDREDHDITGNAKEQGEDPSPGGRERGEKSKADASAPVDMDSAHERAK